MWLLASRPDIRRAEPVEYNIAKVRDPPPHLRGSRTYAAAYQQNGSLAPPAEGAAK